MSKSSDWTDANLEVPFEKDDCIHLRNPKLSLIFDNDTTIPTPPPRKHKKGLREKIEAVAKNSLQAFQAKKPVEEPLCIKKTIKQTCPLDDHDCAIHNRNHKHEVKKKELTDAEREKRMKNIEKEIKQTNKECKRRKNLSVVSLPNYNELKLTLAAFEDIDKKDNSLNNSSALLHNEVKKTTSTGKLETCMTRCRSFGSLLPQQLLGRLKVSKKPIDIESDDSFGGLEDWDLRIIEHYNPRDASLPRTNKLPKNKQNVLSDVEKLIIQSEDTVPKVPSRKSESLLKKINRKASETATRRSQELSNVSHQTSDSKSSITPPSSPQLEKNQKILHPIDVSKLPTREDNGEHSTLLKVLEEFSVRDKQEKLSKNIDQNNEENLKNLSASDQADIQKNITSVEDFLKNEKINSNLHIEANDNAKLITTSI